MLNPVPHVTEGRYLRDILAQPQALDATLAWLGEKGRWENAQHLVHSRRWSRIVLTGMGSSFHALYPLNISLVAAGLTPVMIETSELIHYNIALCDAETLAIVVSQSGASAETVRFLNLNPGASVLAITNTADSLLARRAQLALVTQAGPEFSVSCKTYVCTMLALEWLARVFMRADAVKTAQQLAPIGALTENFLSHWRQSVALLGEKLQRVGQLFLAGRGPSLAAVGTGALIIKESTHLPAEGMSSAAFRHGPLDMVQKELRLLLFTGSSHTRELNQRLAAEVIKRGGECEEIGAGSASQPFRVPESDPLLLPMLEILPIQMVTLALAAASGREAGCFEHARKITDTE